MLNRVYAAYGLVTGISSFFLCLFASFIVTYNNLAYSVIIFGVLFTGIMILVSYYMKERVGLKPSEYSKKDIGFGDYARIHKKKGE